MKPGYQLSPTFVNCRWARLVPTIEIPSHVNEVIEVQTRRFPRYAIDRPLKVVIFWNDSPIRRVHGRATVLGQGGLAARLADQLYIGEVVRVDMPPIRSMYATVRNARGTDHGLEFLYSREGQRDAVNTLCALAEANQL